MKGKKTARNVGRSSVRPVSRSSVAARAANRSAARPAARKSSRSRVSGVHRQASVNRTRNTGMSRADFLRKAGVGAVGLGAAAVGLGGVAKAQADPGDPNPDGLNIVKPNGDPAAQFDPVIWIYPLHNVNPIGSFATMDVRNVQWAVNNVASDGTVVLKVSPHPQIPGFLFTGSGGPGNVYLAQSITIEGEETHATKVLGGVMSFISVAPVHPIIKNIWFDGAYFCPLVLQTCDGATIRDNKITNVVAIDIGFGGNLAYGIAASDLLEGTADGTITIEENYIDLFGDTYNPTGVTSAPGIGLHDFASNPHFEILGNHIHNAPDGILLASFPNGSANIGGNHVTNREYLNIISDWASGCIYIYKHSYGFGRPGPTNIYDNILHQELSSGGSNQEFHGIIMGTCDNCNVSGNSITGNGTTGMMLFYNLDQEEVFENEISGNSVVGGFPQPYRAEDSLWARNPANKLFFQPETQQVYPHLHDNTFGPPSGGLTELYIVNMTEDTFLSKNSATGYSIVPVEELNPHAIGPAKGPKIPA
jgi:parallel beta-helix repeat protein